MGCVHTPDFTVIIMKTLFALFLYLMITSAIFAEIQPIGSLGKGQLKDIFFLPDGRILRVLVNRIELVDSNMNATIARFADRTEHMGKVTVSRDGSRLAIVRTKRSTAQTVIEIWELDSQRRILQGTIPQFLHWNALNPDLTVLAGYMDDGIIRLWNIEMGKSLGKIA